MRKLYEIFKLLWIQKRIVAVATIWGNTVGGCWISLIKFICDSHIYELLALSISAEAEDWRALEIDKNNNFHYSALVECKCIEQADV